MALEAKNDNKNRSLKAQGRLCLAFAALLSIGCQDPNQLRSQLNRWAEKHSLKNTNRASAMLEDGKCPEGTVAKEFGPDGKPLWCRSIDDPSGINSAVRRYPNGQVESEMIQIGDSLKIAKYFESGRPKEQTNYLNGQKHGQYTEWYENGNKKLESNYRAGALNGDYVSRAENGKLIKSGSYTNGLKSGVWSEFDRDGHLQSRVTWRGDRQNGNAESFYRDGTLKEHGAYLNGERDGRWIFYHENGKQRRVGTYVAGKPNGVWVDRDTEGVSSQTYYRMGNQKERPKLTANVDVVSSDTLGAAPPLPKRESYQPQQRRRQGWEPM